jgi:4-hydroxy-tetrahydrodipicolinate synthase
MTLSFAGAGVALITPFKDNGAVDEQALRRLVKRQIEQGIDVLVPCGTTGEAATLDADEQARVIEIVVEEARGKAPILAGAGSNDTRVAIDKTKKAAALGASGVLSVGPYYNKPTAEGYFRHFTAIAEASPLPVVFYNVPGRTAANIDTRTQLRLAEHQNIVGVKEASGNFAQIMDILHDAPPDFEVLSGDDAVTLPMMALGAKGVISVAANQIPGPMRDLAAACLRGDFDEARRIHNRFLRLMSLNFIETNPIPVKASMALMGLCAESFRLPMTPPKDSTRQTLREELASLGLLG